MTPRPRQFQSPNLLSKLMVVGGVLVLGMAIYGPITSFERKMALPMTIGVVICSLGAFFFGMAGIWIGFRRRRYTVEFDETGIRNPDRQSEWLMWEQISGMQFRPLLMALEVTGQEYAPRVRIGLEVSCFSNLVTEVATKATKLWESELYPTELRVKTFARTWPLLGAAILSSLFAYGYWPLLVFALVTLSIVGVSGLLSVPTQLTIDCDGLRASYFFRTALIPFHRVKSVQLNFREVIIQLCDNRILRLYFGATTLGSFCAIHRAVVRGQSGNSNVESGIIVPGKADW